MIYRVPRRLARVSIYVHLDPEAKIATLARLKASSDVTKR